MKLKECLFIKKCLFIKNKYQKIKHYLKNNWIEIKVEVKVYLVLLLLSFYI